MIPRKFHVTVARFPYGGNGGTSSEVPNIADWMVRTAIYCNDSEHVSDFDWFCISDTPITMTRNAAVQRARQLGTDVLVMIDSDMAPDFGSYINSKPFFQSSFEFLRRHYEKGPVVIAAPYCGPPPLENVYVFEWQSLETGAASANFRLGQITREKAAVASGFEAVAALPTGLIMYDMRIFDIVKPPYFAYEWSDEYQSQKDSTEDVMATRDMHLRGIEVLGYNPCYVNWDAWAGHWKPKCVGKPALLRAEDVSEKYRTALGVNVGHKEHLIDVCEENGFQPPPPYRPSENGHAKESHPELHARAAQSDRPSVQDEEAAPASRTAPGRISRKTVQGVRRGRKLRC